MARQLKNWLKTFTDWTLPRSEAPASMITWAGLFTLAAVLKRKVYFPRSLMGSYEIYPNLYVLFIAKPGVVRKSTSASYAEELLIDVSEMMEDESITFAATSMSASKLLDLLSKSPDASMTIISSEFSSFIGMSNQTMYDLLTDIYDGKRKFEYATRIHGLELAERPVVNLLAATTPAWVSKQPPEYFLGGGFASRVLFVYETKRRQYKMYYDDVDYEKIDELGAALTSDLAHIASLSGEFTHESKELRDLMESWYIDFSQQDPDDPRLEGYFQRKHVHVHKIAMLLSVAERDDLVITQAHFEAAKILLEDLEAKLPRAMASIGSNPIGDQLYQMLDFIAERGEVTKKQIATRFIRDLSLEQIDELAAALKIMGKIEIAMNGKHPIYRIIRDSEASPESSHHPAAEP